MADDLLGDFVAAAQSDLEPLLLRIRDELYLDDPERLKAAGVLLIRAWADGATAGTTNEKVAAAVEANLTIDESAVATALAEKVRLPVSIQGVVEAIAARSRSTGQGIDGSATRDEIARELSVLPDEVSGEARNPDGPLGRAIGVGYVEEDPRYKAYWRLTAAGRAQLR
jgi:hypothetical protein